MTGFARVTIVVYMVVLSIGLVSGSVRKEMSGHRVVRYEFRGRRRRLFWRDRAGLSLPASRQRSLCDVRPVQSWQEFFQPWLHVPQLQSVPVAADTPGWTRKNRV